MSEILRLQKIKSDIEDMNLIYQVEVLKILTNDKTVNISENNNGIFINLSDLNNETIMKLENFIVYVNAQQKQLSNIEIEKDIIKSTFFMKKNKFVNQNDDNIDEQQDQYNKDKINETNNNDIKNNNKDNTVYNISTHAE